TLPAAATSPPPPRRLGAPSGRRARSGAPPVETSADLTCATVQPGCRCSSSAAAPATCGEAMLVPSSNAHEPSWAGTEERMLTPGAVTSGLSASETGVGPPDEK